MKNEHALLCICTVLQKQEGDGITRLSICSISMERSKSFFHLFKKLYLLIVEGYKEIKELTESEVNF